MEKWQEKIRLFGMELEVDGCGKTECGVFCLSEKLINRFVDGMEK